MYTELKIEFLQAFSLLPITMHEMGSQMLLVGTTENCCYKMALMLFQPVSGSKDFKHFMTTA